MANLGTFYSGMLNKLLKSRDITSSYHHCRNIEHIFIYGVLGRSSTTALQRILNSSNEITISGESKGIVTQLLHTLSSLNSFENAFRDNYDRFKSSFMRNKHNRVYPMALDTSGCSTLVKNSLVALLKPLHGGLRFGFKDIEASSIDDLEALRKLFPRSRFVFIFRDPVSQYQSVQAQKFWHYSKSVDSFVSGYVALSDLYIRFAQTSKTGVFFENEALYDHEKVQVLLKVLSISNYDRALIGDAVFSSENKRGDCRRDFKIKNSKAYDAYNRLKELAM